jgi:hypothetical protein
MYKPRFRELHIWGLGMELKCATLPLSRRATKVIYKILYRSTGRTPAMPFHM